MKKRITVLLMACILALSMPVSVLAAEGTKITALYKEPAIDVRVSSSATAGDLLINPYGLPVTVDGEVRSSAEIISKPWSIQNRSNVALRLDAKVSAQVGTNSKIEFCSRSVKTDRSGDKKVFLFLDYRVTDPDVALSDLNWDETVYSRTKNIIITEYEEEREKIMTLAAADEDGSVANGGVGAFCIGGNVAPKPDEAWNPTVDRVAVNVVFTFHPTVLNKFMYPGMTAKDTKLSGIHGRCMCPGFPSRGKRMRKLAIYLLSIAGVLWAVHPAALAAAEQGENGYSVSHDTDSESVVSTADAAEALAEDPVIKVDVPGKGEMVINPYCLTVELDGGTITDQIFNKEQILVNHSKVPVIVGVSVTAETSEGSTLAITNQPIEPGESDKLAYLYVEFQDLPNEDSVPSWAGAYTGAFNQILVSPDGSATGDVLRLEAGDNVPVRAAYRLFGSLSSYPLDEWESGDGLTVTVRFTFREEGNLRSGRTAGDTR